MIVMLDERCNLGFEIFLEEIVLQEDSVLQLMVPAFDVGFGLRSASRFLPKTVPSLICRPVYHRCEKQ